MTSRPVILTLAGMVVALVGTAVIRAQHVEVVDGDSLKIAGERIRLHGIDAPELAQECRTATDAPYPCGLEARAFLERMIAGQAVTCEPAYPDIYGRTIATCTIGDKDLAAEMVRAGWALDVPRYSGGKYLAAEIEARQAKRGIWQGAFQQPYEWRQEHPRRPR